MRQLQETLNVEIDKDCSIQNKIGITTISLFKLIPCASLNDVTKQRKYKSLYKKKECEKRIQQLDIRQKTNIVKEYFSRCFNLGVKAVLK